MATIIRYMLVSTLLCLPLTAGAQSNDSKYCSALIDKYQTFLGGSGSGRHADVDQDAIAKMAIEKCKSGDTSTGIPILEGKLRDAKIELPTRG